MTATEFQWSFDMDSAPKDKPVLLWHVSDHMNADCGYCGTLAEGDTRGTLCMFHAHAEGLSSHSINGPVVGIWTGAFDDSTWEYPNQASLPDWWFLHDEDQEIAINPVAWCPIPNFAETDHDHT